MDSIESFLREVVRSVEPTPTQKEYAQRSHNSLRDKLCSGNMSVRIVSSYLSGSYARDTAIAPLDDVDVIFLINKEFWQDWFDGAVGLRPSPSKVLATFSRAVRYRYPESSVVTQRRSIRLDLSRISIDVVPAIEKTQETILIGDVSKDHWLESSPRRHAACAAAVNEARSGLFKPLVKLLKLWNSNLPSTARFKSFAIETMAVRLFASVRFDSLEDGFSKFLDFVSHLGNEGTRWRWADKYGMSLSGWSCEVPDTAGTGGNVVAGVDDSQRRRFIENALISSRRMGEAATARNPDSAVFKVRQALRA